MVQFGVGGPAWKLQKRDPNKVSFLL
jgi:hypothetical protein